MSTVEPNFKRLVLVAMLSLIMLYATPLWAHKVSVFAWVEGDTVFTQSRFSGGKKPKNAVVTVFDPDSNLLLEGRTDNQGEFSFPIPKRCALRIVLAGGMGHLGEWTVPVDEIPHAVQGTTVGTAPAVPDQEGHTHAPTPVQALDQEQLLLAVEQALDRKLKPVIQMLSDERQQGPSLNEILGGIGYIIGLVGLGAYIHARKTRPRD